MFFCSLYSLYPMWIQSVQIMSTKMCGVIESFVKMDAVKVVLHETMGVN